MRNNNTNLIIMILNLDQNFKPLDGKEVEFENFIFSGGEPHIKISPLAPKGGIVKIGRASCRERVLMPG